MKKIVLAFAAVASLATFSLSASEASARGFGGHGGGHGGGHAFHGGGHWGGGHFGHRGYAPRRVGFVTFAGGSCFRKVWTPYGFVIRNICRY